ncbi:MAG: hypothetical protein ACP5KN_17330 [Armatimonadota bacterium]
MSDTSTGHEGWIISAAGQETTRRFEAPVDLPGWEGQPWVVLRPLTAREALRRESLGLVEEYELAGDGTPRVLRRTYDAEAMVEFELQRCLVDYELPIRRDGEVEKLAPGGELGKERRDLLDVLPPALMSWLVECLGAVNMRRAADVGVLAKAKKG